MSKVFALIVGIDRYSAFPPLLGCRNDATAARAYLGSRTGPDDLKALELYDEKATRAAVIDRIRHHLGRAGPQDTAVFWYAGHGSLAPLPPELRHLEPSGYMQTLVCADSRTGDVPDLYDKELSVLLDHVAAKGCHVAVVLDSCHSAGAVRGEVPEEAARSRRVAPATRIPSPGSLIPELRHDWTAALPDRSRLVALTACRSDQLAHELPIDDRRRGVFSWALLRALNQLGPRATYRELLAAARCSVENRVQFQAPQLAGDEPADRPFLGGALRPATSAITMRRLGERWEIDAGECHGVPPGPARVAVAGDGPVRAARVVSVSVDRSIVEPDGWAPDPERQYPVVFIELSQGALTVAVDAPAEEAERIAKQIAGSAYLQAAGPAAAAVPDLRFRLPAGTGRVEIFGADGRELTPPIVAADAAERARISVRAGEHIARWRQVRALSNPASPLAGGVRLEVVPARPGERIAPLDRAPLRPGSDGLIRLSYRREDGVWRPPTVFIRLRNDTDQPLYCGLLDLTGRYRIHARLFPGEFVAARSVGAALSGRPVQFSLPSGESPAPGTQVRDWLKLIAAEDEFGTRPFEQDALDDAGRRGSLPSVRMVRDADAAEPDEPYDWAACVVEVLTEVPA